MTLLLIGLVDYIMPKKAKPVVFATSMVSRDNYPEKNHCEANFLIDIVLGILELLRLIWFLWSHLNFRNP